ncbi:DUF982 domain-containing protein [Neorhizobium galegae]|uniref:DUF982 domain-containing protein n=1 Tax=Neorhizobium galegae TaxID=399 RepID=UPI00351CC0B6
MWCFAHWSPTASPNLRESCVLVAGRCGKELVRAREIFHDAMSGSRPRAEARASFMRAAREAYLDIRGD